MSAVLCFIHSFLSAGFGGAGVGVGGVALTQDCP